MTAPATAALDLTMDAAALTVALCDVESVSGAERALADLIEDALCDLCSDERKGQKVLGMTILRGARPDADKALWEGGDVLDPNNGKVYKLRLKPIDGGKKLEVRGFIGMALLGRTQTWIRIE